MKRIFGKAIVLAALALLVIGIAGLAGCGYGSPPAGTTAPTTPAATQPPQAGTHESVSIAGFAFSPATLTVPAGTTVTWTNNDATTHTVTSDTGAFNSSFLSPGATFSFTFTQAGTYKYHCSIHTYMTAEVVVQ